MSNARNSYPVFVSPDGHHEQVAATMTRRVHLRFRGWHEKKPLPQFGKNTRASK